MENLDYWSILVDSGSIVQWLPDLIKHPSCLRKTRCHRMNTESGSESSNRNNISVLFFCDRYHQFITLGVGNIDRNC